MRYVYGLFLLVLVGVLVVFAALNSEGVPIRYYDQSFAARTITLPLAEIMGGAYLLGMLSGWTVIGVLKRSVQRVTERPE